MKRERERGRKSQNIREVSIFFMSNIKLFEREGKIGREREGGKSERRRKKAFDRPERNTNYTVMYII